MRESIRLPVYGIRHIIATASLAQHADQQRKESSSFEIRPELVLWRKDLRRRLRAKGEL
jgi:hypothetical protein